jgi:hypothetical protein
MRGPRSLPALVVLGRGARDPQGADDERMCPRHEIAEKAAAAGVNVTKRICGPCPLRSTCGYMRQSRGLEAQRDSGGALYILSHAYTALPTPAAMPSPDLVIVDESILPTMAGVVAFAPDRITAQELPVRALNVAPGFASTMANVRQAIEAGKGRELAALRDAGVTLDEIKRAKRALDLAAEDDLADISGDATDEQIERDLAEHEKSEAGLVALLLRQIAREWVTGRDGLNSADFAADAPVTVDGKRERQARLWVSYLKAFRPGSKRPVLALDGTGDVRLYRPLFGRRMAETRIAVERRAEVVQVRGKVFSSQSIDGCTPAGEALGDAPALRATRLRRELAAFVACVPGDRKLVVSTKRAREALELELTGLPGVTLAHFGAIRGVNAYKDCDAGIIIGREQPTATTIERLAGAYAAGDPEPLNRAGAYTKAIRGRRLKGGGVEAEEIDTHPDPRCQAVLEQAREAEIVQAVDRLRLIHNSEPKRVYLLTSIPVDVTADRSLRWGELAEGGTGAELSLAALSPSVAAVTAESLAEHVCTSVRFARKQFTRLFAGVERQGDLTEPNANRYYWQSVPKGGPKQNANDSALVGWRAFEYAQSGRPCRCLVRAGVEPYAAIQSLVGPVRWVRALGELEPTPRPANAPPLAVVPEPLDAAHAEQLAAQALADVEASGGAPPAVLEAFETERASSRTIADVRAACRRYRDAARAARCARPPPDDDPPTAAAHAAEEQAL